MEKIEAATTAPDLFGACLPWPLQKAVKGETDSAVKFTSPEKSGVLRRSPLEKAWGLRRFYREKHRELEEAQEYSGAPHQRKASLVVLRQRTGEHRATNGNVRCSTNKRHQRLADPTAIFKWLVDVAVTRKLGWVTRIIGASAESCRLAQRLYLELRLYIPTLAGSFVVVGVC